LSLISNEYKLSASRTAAGRLFHTFGPATEKALFCREILFLSVELYSQCWTPSGDESVPDHHWTCNLLIG